jgi:hypothetical protein
VGIVPITDRLRVALQSFIEFTRGDRELDENYQTYLNRVMRLTLPETYQAQGQNVQESPKFQRDSAGNWQANSFPGYSVITPPGAEDQENAAVYQALSTFQSTIGQQLGPDLFIPLPAASFHLTLADLIWDSAYQHAQQENPDFDQQLQTRIGQSLQASPPLASTQPIGLQILGLVAMPRAIAVCLAPKDESSYDRILKLRRTIYQNPDVIAIGIEQQYYFTPHITLGYFGSLAGVDRETLPPTFDQLNQLWIANPPQHLAVHRAELRKFDNMTAYHRQPNWATFRF